MPHARRAKLAFALTCAFVVISADGALPVAATVQLASAQVASAPPAALVAPKAASVEQRKAAVDKQLRKLRQDLEGTSNDLVEAAVALRRAKLRLADARAELAQARRELTVARQRDEELAQRLELARIGAAKAREELGRSEQAERDTREQLGRIASETYRSAAISTLSVALEAQSPEQFSARMAVAGAALRVQNGAISRLEGQQAEGRAQRAKLDALEAQVGELKRQAAIVVRKRQAAEAKAAAAEREVTSLVVGRARALVTIQKRKAAEKARLARLAKQQAHLRKILAERARRSKHHYSPGNGLLAHPVNAPISSGFGWRMHPIFHYRRLHSGTDFAAPCGTPVHAAKGGRVIIAGWAGGYGRRVVVYHGGGLATTYNHLSRIVKYSGRVRTGQVIAYSGTTGSSTGCHLHFEVLLNGSFTNPMRWL